MKRILVAVVVVVMCVVSAQLIAQAQEGTGAKFGGVVVGGASVTATVDAIHAETRTVTLKTKDGQVKSVKCGPEVKNFAQIAKGDTVNIDYTEYVSIAVGGPGAVPTRADSTEVSRAALGEKPAGTITTTTDVVGKVKAIDYTARTVTLEGPNKTVTVKVDAAAVNFDKVKAGDTVYMQYVQEMAVAVTK